MDKLWKWIMRLNAKAFCLVAVLFFVGVAAYCAWLYTHPPAPIQDGHGGSRPPEATPAWTIGTLDFVTNQLTAETLVLPIDPFKPTIEAILTNEVERTAFLKALKAAQASAAGIAGGNTAAGTSADTKKDPFAHLRKKAAVPGGLVGPDGKPLVVPKLYFEGFLQRPDGTRVAMFRDSTENTTIFYEPGKKVHGVEILSANVREAELRLPNGTTRTLKIGGAPADLDPEPAKAPVKKAIVPVKAGAAAAAKPGAAAAAKPGAKPGAAAADPGKAQQKPGAQQKKAAQQKRNQK